MDRSFALPCFLTAVVILCTPTDARSALPPSEQVLPATTKAYLSIGNMPKLIAAWNLAPIGRLLNDPDMQEFSEDLKRQLHEKGALLQDRLGISLSDLETLPTGELALAVVRLSDDKAALVVLIDVTNNLAAAGQTIQKIDAALMRDGAKRNMHPSEFAKAPLTVYEIPPKGNRKQTAQAVYFIENDVLVVADSLAVAEDVLSRLAAPKPDSLAHVPGYEAVMARCAKQGGQFESHLKWWADPVGAVEAVQNSFAQKPSRNLVKLAQKEGFTAIQAAGGFVSFATKPFGLLHRTAVIAPPPHERSMKILSFPNAPAHDPENWVPASVASYTTFQWDMLNAFENFGSLFDEIVGEGEEGVWGDVIDSMKNDPNGPQLDLRNDLIVHLGKRCSILIDNVEPIGLHSQRRLFAAEAINEKDLADAVEKAMKNDEGVKVRVFKAGDVEYKIFEIVPEEQPLPALQVDTAEPKPAEAKPAEPQQTKPAEQDQAKPVDQNIDPLRAGGVPAGEAGDGENIKDHELPHSVVTVGQGYLLISSHVELLEEILSHPQALQPLASAREYQHIASQFQQLITGPQSAQGFIRNDERYHVSYELFRQGRLNEADLPAREVLDAIFDDGDEGQIRKPRLDGRKLPDYAVVRKHLGLGGSFVQSEDQGWFVLGFTMNEKLPPAPEAAQARRSPAPAD